MKQVSGPILSVQIRTSANYNTFLVALFDFGIWISSVSIIRTVSD